MPTFVIYGIGVLMSGMNKRWILALAVALQLALTARAHGQAANPVDPSISVVSQGLPPISDELAARLQRYENTRNARFVGWLDERCLLIQTRFAETDQVHRVCSPLGQREQLSFADEATRVQAVAGPDSLRQGFVYGRDRGGDEFFQLYWYDLKSRDEQLLSDGSRSRNTSAVISDDGRWLAYSSNLRNGRDSDVWLKDLTTGERRPLVSVGGSWAPTDFSADGKRLLVSEFRSISDSRPAEVTLADASLRLFPVDGGSAAIEAMRYLPEDDGVIYISDEPIDGRPQEFKTLRMHRPGAPLKVVSADIPWDVQDFAVSRDGRMLAYSTLEDGISQLRLLRLPSLKPMRLPELPMGVMTGLLEFSSSADRLAFSLTSATRASDVYVIDLRSTRLQRWTQSELGGLDENNFVGAELIRYPSFDSVDGAVRQIPAFVYRPRRPAPAAGHPVVIRIHGGPESQSQPVFSPVTQFMLNELGIAVIEPNVRGSAGYGKTYLQLDNGMLREDSVRDIGALLDWIDAQGDLDASRVGVLGGSYGGYMVLASLIHYPERIRAGIDVVGISHFGTFLRNTQDYRRDLRRAEYGDERDPQMAQFFDRIAPLNRADRIRSPLFVAQGYNDPRVPYTEAEQIVAAARGNDQPVWFLMFPDEGHGFQKKVNRDRFNAASMQFWQQFLLPEATAPARSGAPGS